MTTIPIVDVEATGIRIRKLLDDANISIRELQYIIGFTTRNAIYKWTQSKCLPSIDNLVVLSMVLGVPMNEIVVVRYSA